MEGLASRSGPQKKLRLGKYELLRHLATGGMAEIYLARAKGIEGFEKLVVAKKLLPQSAGDEALRGMFLDEARVAATLHHPNIVQVYDIGVDEDEYFFTMEFVHGQDLSHALRRAATMRRPLTLDQALTIVIGMCAGLHHAHEKEGADGRPLGLVHRDVSPQNVLISYDGAVKLMDFGIAKAASNSQKTRDGTLKGKIAYMSPEQGSSGKVDRRSDVFSLAIVLWELTTFRRLYKAESDFETLRRIITENAPPPSRYRPTYPKALEQIVMKGLRRAVDERYQTAEEMQLDLEAFAREQRLVVSSVSTGRYMKELFHDRVDAWATAQRNGTSFVDFLVAESRPEEGTGVTGDSWVAPPTEPTSTTSMPEAPEIELDEGDEAAPVSLHGGRRRWIAGLAIAAVAGVGLWLWQRGGSASDETPAPAPVAPAGTEPPPPAPAPAPGPAPVAAEPPTPAPAAPADPATKAQPAATHPAVRPTRPPSSIVHRPPPTKTPTPPPVKKKDLDSPYPE